MRQVTKEKYQLKCQVCEVSFGSRSEFTKTCSEDCRKMRQSKLSGRLSYKYGQLNSGTIGAISEMEAAIDLMAKGYAVFRALSPACFCDLIASKNGVSYRVEVRTGYRSPSSNNMSFPKNLHGEVDMFAVVERNTREVIYYSPLIEPMTP